LIEITNDGSYVLITCVIGVWQHVLDLWRVCVLSVHTQATGPECMFLGFYTTQILRLRLR